jgi:hypothetical protein
MAFNKASREFVPPTHRKNKVRSDKGKKRVRKVRKDKGKIRLPKMLLPAVALPRKKGGPLSKEEKTVVEAMVMSVQEGESDADLQTRGRALGLALGRSPEAIRKAVINARQRLQERAVDYADIHFEAAKRAAVEGDAKPAEWALERITAPTENGKGVERIVQPLKSGDEMSRLPTVNIGLNLGGIAPGASMRPGLVGITTAPLDGEIEKEP